MDVMSTFLTEEEEGEEEEMAGKQSSFVLHLMTIVPEPVGRISSSMSSSQWNSLLPPQASVGTADVAAFN